jgi:hypothetical protein
LSIDIEARLAGLQEGLDKAATVADRNARHIESSFNRIGNAASMVRTVISTLGATFTVGMFVDMIKGSIDAADHLNDLSKATGISVTTLGGLGFAASQAGTDLDGVALAMGKLNVTIAKAGAGDKTAAGVFDALGIAVKDAAGQMKTADVIFAEMTTKFEGYADGPNKAALAQAAFGRSWQSIMPLMADGGEALRKNIGYYEQFGKVTADVAKAADEFNDTLGKLHLLTQAFATETAAKMLPTLQRIADELLRSKENSGLFALASTELARGLKDIAMAGAEALYELKSIAILADGFWSIVKKAGDITGPTDVEGMRADMSATMEATKAARLEYERFVAVMNAPVMTPAGKHNTGGRLAGGSGRPDAPPLPGTGGGSEPKAQKPWLDSRGNEALTAALNAVSSTDVDKVRKLNAELTELFTLQRESRGDAGVVQAIANVRAELEKLDPAMVAAAEDKKILDAVLAATPSIVFAGVLREIDLINKAFDDGAKDTERWAEAILVATSHLKGGETKAAIDDMTKFAEQAARNIQDALGTTVEATLSGHFDSIAELWRNMLIKLVSEAIAANLGQALLGDFGKSGKIGGYLGELIGLFTSANGNAFGNGKAFASGGILGANGGMLTQPTIFKMANGGIGIGGEAGTEAVMPLARGRNGKLGVHSSGGGSVVNINQVMNIGSGVSRAEVYAASLQAKNAAKAEIIQLMRRGGAAA